MEDNVKDRVLKCIEINEIEILEDGSLLDVDSIRSVYLVLTLEEEFNIEFPYEFLISDSLKNIYSICAEIEKLI